MFIRTDYLRYFVENLKLSILAPSVDNEQIQIECFDFGQTVCFDFRETVRSDSPHNIQNLLFLFARKKTIHFSIF